MRTTESTRTCDACGIRARVRRFAQVHYWDDPRETWTCSRCAASPDLGPALVPVPDGESVENPSPAFGYRMNRASLPPEAFAPLSEI